MITSTVWKEQAVTPSLQCARENAWDVSACAQKKQSLYACLVLLPSRLLAWSSSAQRRNLELCSASFCWHCMDRGLGTLDSLVSSMTHGI